MTPRIAQTVVHYALNDPRTHRGGVEAFARTLALTFEEVLFMTPATRDDALVQRERLPVICDNHWVTDWPPHIPVIGFQHGVAALKMLVVPGLDSLKMAWRQRLAAKRPNTVWVACARWISDTFARLHGNAADHIVYHSVDLERFDGRRRDIGSRLVLHDGRTPHKGSRLYPVLDKELPAWRFEPLACGAEEVPDRMREAAAFIHLSRYEGNSIVCNEAMAMDLPCLFTRVGLMRDGVDQFDVEVMSANRAFFHKRALVARVADFLDGLRRRSYSPRRWVVEHATIDANRRAWGEVLESFRAVSGWR